ncbi:thioesterase family protein [Desulfobulbus rhabdoformis]|uniref:thioesterase family protein n=1 Tax=Desulfobulbus rhabdoformis TaxID=34032 RepID=UPI001964C096|nr:thioesterase family protein [Desulfobulbus rhabdoformis]MBM9612761.1 thioesterase family protein [Desulfobulbus rhabdoformis]
MELQIPAEVKGKQELVVTLDDTAAKYGSGLVEVYATPAMVALMEKTCLQSVLPYLPQGHGTVGIKIDVSHSKATPVGMKVTCESTLIEVDRRRLVFEVLATDEKGEIGRGRHERFVIDTAKFMEKL